MNGYVAKYLRISDDDEDMGGRKTESDSIGNQRKVLDVYIKNHPELSQYPLREYLDDGFSGVNFHRPGIQGLLKEVRENRIACIVVKDLSRFGRNYIEVGDYIEQIFRLWECALSLFQIITTVFRDLPGWRSVLKV